MSFWVDHISNQVPSKQIKSQLCNLKHFVIQKLKILDFHFNCLSGVLTNRPSIWRNFTCWNFNIIDIPSMKQNNAKFGLFVGFPKFEGIIEFSQIFLKVNEIFHLFFEGVVELWIYRWENAFESGYFKTSSMTVFFSKKTYLFRKWFVDCPLFFGVTKLWGGHENLLIFPLVVPLINIFFPNCG